MLLSLRYLPLHPPSPFVPTFSATYTLHCRNATMVIKTKTLLFKPFTWSKDASAAERDDDGGADIPAAAGEEQQALKEGKEIQNDGGEREGVAHHELVKEEQEQDTVVEVGSNQKDGGNEEQEQEQDIVVQNKQSLPDEVQVDVRDDDITLDFSTYYDDETDGDASSFLTGGESMDAYDANLKSRCKTTSTGGSKIHDDSTSSLCFASIETFFEEFKDSIDNVTEEIMRYYGFSKKGGGIKTERRLRQVQERLAEVEEARKRELEEVQNQFQQAMSQQIKLLMDEKLRFETVEKSSYVQKVQKLEKAELTLRQVQEQLAKVEEARKRELAEVQSNFQQTMSQQIKLMEEKLMNEAINKDSNLEKQQKLENEKFKSLSEMIKSLERKLMIEAIKESREQRQQQRELEQLKRELAMMKMREDAGFVVKEEDRDDISPKGAQPIDREYSFRNFLENSNVMTPKEVETIEGTLRREQKQQQRELEQLKRELAMIKIREDAGDVVKEEDRDDILPKGAPVIEGALDEEAPPTSDDSSTDCTITSTDHMDILAEVLEEDSQYVNVKRKYPGSSLRSRLGKSLKSKLSRNHNHHHLQIDSISNDNLELIGAAIGNSFSYQESELTKDEISVVSKSLRVPSKLSRFRNRIVSLNLMERMRLLKKLTKGLREPQLKRMTLAMVIGYKQTQSKLQKLDFDALRSSKYEPGSRLSSVPEFE